MAVMRPTHHVRHNDGFEAHIYIAESLEKQLASRNSEEQKRARNSVCIRIRKAFQAKHPRWNTRSNPNWLDWDDVKITKLDKAEKAVKRKSPWDIPCSCDDCQTCDQGHCPSCRNCARSK